MTGDEIQSLGRQMLLALQMLTRSVKIYSTDNAIFLKPLNALLEQINRVVSLEGKIDVAVVGLSLYVNSRLIRIDQPSLESLKQLAQSFQAQGVGGFMLNEPATLEELRNFFALFVGDGRAVEELPEDGLPSHPLRQMRLRPWSAQQELKGPQKAIEPDSPEGRRRRALVAYARALVWAEYQATCARDARPDDASSASIRIAQDLVETAFEDKGGLLAMLVNGEDERAVPHHMVNTALIAIVFGTHLGVTKVQLKDLAIAALNNETVLAKLPAPLWLPADPAKLSGADQAQRAAARKEAARAALSGGRAGSRLNLLRALSCIEIDESHTAVARSQSQEGAAPPSDLLYLSRILAIAAHYDVLTSPSGQRPACSPDQALGAMWGPLRSRFDPELLWVFVRVMAPLPLKVMPRRAGGIIDATG